MKNTPIGIRLILLFFSAMSASAQDLRSDSDSLLSNPAFVKNCAKCHGKTARGRLMRGPSLASAKVGEIPSAELHTTITNGKGHMPKFEGKLSSEEIDTLIDQIKQPPNKR